MGLILQKKKSLAEHLLDEKCDNNFINTLGEAKNVIVEYATSLTIKHLLGDTNPMYYYLIEDECVNNGRFFAVKGKNLKYFPFDILNIRPNNFITYMKQDISITKNPNLYNSLIKDYQLPEGVGVLEAFVETESDLFIALQNKANVPTSEDYKKFDNFVYIKSNGSNQWISYNPEISYNPGYLGLRLNGTMYPTSIFIDDKMQERAFADSPVTILQRIRPLHIKI